MKPLIITPNCTRLVRECRADAVRGLFVHAVASCDVYTEPLLVMPSYHFQTTADALSGVQKAWDDAVMIEDDADLYYARIMSLPHKLPVGWVDPSRR